MFTFGSPKNHEIINTFLHSLLLLSNRKDGYGCSLQRNILTGDLEIVTDCQQYGWFNKDYETVIWVAFVDENDSETDPDWQLSVRQEIYRELGWDQGVQNFHLTDDTTEIWYTNFTANAINLHVVNNVIHGIDSFEFAKATQTETGAIVLVDEKNNVIYRWKSIVGDGEHGLLYNAKTKTLFIGNVIK